MKKIVVLAGGRGSEREVSVASGRRVAEALCHIGVRTALIDPVSEVDPFGECFFTDIERLKESSTLFSAKGGDFGRSKNKNAPASANRGGLGMPKMKSELFLSEDGAEKSESNFNEGDGCGFSAGYFGDNAPFPPPFSDVSREKWITESALRVCQSADAVFIMLHGGIGENGRLQALFECLGIKYFGSSPEGCAAAMDKLLTKRIFESALIPSPVYTVYKKGQLRPPIPPRYPCVVKPANEGSSVGVSIVKKPQELEKALNAALESNDTVLMEAWIKGREFTVGIIGDRALAVTEIIPKSGFYDYESKYTEGRTLEVTPAELSEALTERLLRLAERAHRALSLSDFSRVDIMIEDKTELIYVLEVNTVPGMTKTSLLPLAAEYRGIDFNELCRRMAHL